MVQSRKLHPYVELGNGEVGAFLPLQAAEIRYCTSELTMALIEKTRTALRVVKDLLVHEANSAGGIPPVLRFFGWQALKRIRAKPITIAAFGDAKLRCYPDNAATNAVIYYGRPDWSEMNFLMSVLQPGDGFLDIGANVGVYSILASQCVGPDGKVVAFEPDPSNVARLRENFQLNGIPLDGIHRVAVGESQGTCSFEVGKDAVGSVRPDGGTAAESSSTMAVVKQVRLDECIAEPTDFSIAKIDVEGFELRALKGAEQLLESGSPFCWLIETNGRCEAYGTSVEDIHDYISQYGYILYRLEEDGSVLSRIPRGGPYPLNSVAVNSLQKLLERSDVVVR